MSSYKDERTTEGYARGARPLANWLVRQYGQPQVMSNSEFEKSFWYKGAGIIFVSNVQAPGAEEVNHIDLFNKGYDEKNAYMRGTEIWYWEIK